MKILNKNEFTNFDELEEVNVVEISTNDEVKGGVIIKSNSMWETTSFHVRWDLLVSRKYVESQNYANSSWEITEVIYQDDIRTIVKITHKYFKDYDRDWGWGNYERREESKIIIVKHDDLSKIKSRIAFRRQFIDILEYFEYDMMISKYENEEEEIEELEEIEEIEEVEFFQHCKECSHPLGHLFLDQCPCGYKEQ